MALKNISTFSCFLSLPLPEAGLKNWLCSLARDIVCKDAGDADDITEDGDWRLFLMDIGAIPLGYMQLSRYSDNIYIKFRLFKITDWQCILEKPFIFLLADYSKVLLK